MTVSKNHIFLLFMISIRSIFHLTRCVSFSLCYSPALKKRGYIGFGLSNCQMELLGIYINQDDHQNAAICSFPLVDTLRSLSPDLYFQIPNMH